MEKDEEYNEKEIEEDVVKDYLPKEDTEEKSKIEEEDDSIYSEERRDELMEDDEISPEEEGFMEGYDEAYA